MTNPVPPARLHERFEQFMDDEFLKFDRIENPQHPRRDVCGFLILHDLVPGTAAMISDARHDEYFLSIDCGALNAAATDAAIRDLVRCGIRHDEMDDCLAVFP